MTTDLKKCKCLKHEISWLDLKNTNKTITRKANEIFQENNIRTNNVMLQMNVYHHGIDSSSSVGLT